VVDPHARRLIVAAAVRLHVARRLGAGTPCRNLHDAARRLRGADELRRTHGVTFDPGYPGATAGIRTVEGGERLVLACRAHLRGVPAAVVVTSLIRGRPAQVSAAPVEAGVPPEWAPL
jgi:hypothetical protein